MLPYCSHMTFWWWFGHFFLLQFVYMNCLERSEPSITEVGAPFHGLLSQYLWRLYAQLSTWVGLQGSQLSWWKPRPSLWNTPPNSPGSCSVKKGNILDSYTHKQVSSSLQWKCELWYSSRILGFLVHIISMKSLLIYYKQRQIWCQPNMKVYLSYPGAQK